MLLRKCRELRLALWVPLLFVSAPAWSLGLSEIEVDSALNERFSATIDLMDAGDLQKEEVLVSLASREDFDRVGVERFFYLTDMTFEVDMRGAPKIRVGSSQVISEPYLNFLVEVRWPRGRLLKEYTVLLDPPTFSAAAAPAVQAPSSTPSQPQPAAERQTSGDRLAVPSRPQPRRQVTAGDGEVVSTTDDTLWKIASRTLPSERVTVNQQMVAIQRLNPQAFIRNNINLLKAGYRLKLPTESEALATEHEDAVAMAREQTAAWRDPGAQQVADSTPTEPLRSQVDATAEPAQPQDTRPAGEGQVRIVANSGELSQGSAAEGDPAAAELLESNETLNRQVEELNYQLDREKELAATQLELKDRQLEVRDQELAQLQERLSRLEEQIANQQQNQTAENQPQPAEPLPWWQSPTLLGGVIGVLVLLLAWALFMVRRKAQEQEEALAYVEQNYADQEPSVGDVLEDDALAVAAVAAAEDDEDDETETEAEAPLKEDDEDQYLIDEDDDLSPAAEDDEAPVAEGEDAPAGTDADTTDVVAEADIYIAYGRYGQATSLLVGALEKDPSQHEVRLKLLEVCVEAEDPEQFAVHADYLVNNCEDQDILMATRDLEARMNDSVTTLDSLDFDGGDAPETPSDTDAHSDTLADDELLDLELDGEQNTPAGSATSEESAASEKNAAGEDDFELEFDDLEVDEDPEEVAADTAADPAANAAALEAEDDAGLGDELGGDLGIDFDPDRDVDGAEQDTTATSEDLDDLEFDLDLEEDGEAGADSSADGEDFDFGDDGDGDINNTKLDLAEAYIDMGDGDGAQDILREVLDDGSDTQKEKAQKLLDSIAS